MPALQFQKTLNKEVDILFLHVGVSNRLVISTNALELGSYHNNLGAEAEGSPHNQTWNYINALAFTCESKAQCSCLLSQKYFSLGVWQAIKMSVMLERFLFELD